MDENLNKLLVSEIQKCLPEKKRVVPYLMETLELGRESIYRRLRNNIPFSVEEMVKLSMELGFSIDEVVGKNSNKRIFFDLPSADPADPMNIYSEYMADTIHILKKLSKSKNSQIISAHSKLPLSLIIHLKNLSKFLYFRWLHQTHSIPLNFLLSDIHIPLETHSLYNSLYYNYLKIEEITVILDESIFSSVIREITYYYKRNIIKKDELIALKEELNQAVDRIEILTEKGTNDAGTKINLFISSFRVESTYFCFEYDDGMYTQVWSHIMPSITMNKPEICTIQKKRIEAYKKFSILITQCNEIQRSEYLNKQRKLINEMTKGLV